MLEVGIFRGAGIASWLEWWPKAEIVGIDTFQRVEPIRVPILQHKRVKWFKADSRTAYLDGQFDVIFDDGDHRPLMQLKTFRNLFDYLADDGRYFIEDVQPGPGFADLSRKLEPFGAVHHDLRHGYRPDSYLIEIRR